MSDAEVDAGGAARSGEGEPRRGESRPRQGWITTPEHDGWRVDAFLARQLGLSAARARRLWEAGTVRVDGRRVVKGERLKGGARVELESAASLEDITAAAAASPNRVDASILPDPTMSLTLLYEDAHLIAIDKPAGVPSHPLRAGERGTAASAIVARFPECAGVSPVRREGGLGHRLDTGTSGVLLAARSATALAGLRRALAAATCEKTYLAEVRGHPPSEGHVTAAIGRTGRRGASVSLDGGRNPQPAETVWSLDAQGPETALVLARLQRGRAHQVRAHLAGAGFPIVGDERYGTREPAGKGFHLHALSVRLVHPVSGTPLTIFAPRPGWGISSRFGA